MHPWHDCYVDDYSVEKHFPVIIEVPKGSKNKYELDKETGLLKLDRVLFSAVIIRRTTGSFHGPIATTAIRWMCWCWGRNRCTR